jgi:phosphomannomutase
VKQDAIRRARADDMGRLGPYSIMKKEHLDGIKFFLDAPTNGNGADAWILFRASGTEPLLRVYCEAASPDLVTELLGCGEAFATQAG